MTKLNTLYCNKNRLVDIVNVEDVAYVDGVKTVTFTRLNKDLSYRLPIEMFEKNFIETPVYGNSQ